MHEIKEPIDWPVSTDPEMELEAAKIEYQLANEINYWGEADYGKAQTIEIPLFMLDDLLNQPPFEVKEQLRKWYEYGQKTDQEREIEQKS